MSQAKMVSAAELVEDFDLYPRHDVDSVHVNNLLRALEADCELPPIIADRTSKRIVDGFHRRRAWIKHGGPEVRIPTVFKSYANEAALFEDAVRCNSTHGRKLDRQDEVRITIIAQRLNINTQSISIALHITEKRVEELMVRVHISEATNEMIPAKPVSDHLYGQKITEEQQETLKHFGGHNLLQTIGEVRSAVKSGLFDKDDQRVLDALHGLAKIIKDSVPRKVE